jgi:CheY-like chemotaxis protein
VPNRSPLVLVAEDYADARALFARCLSEAGFDVIEAEDGARAVALAREHSAEAVVMDLHMPNVDGWEATRQIRAELGEGPYIIAVSANDGAESRRLAFDAGCDGYVVKPVDPKVLCTIVKTALDARPPKSR